MKVSVIIAAYNIEDYIERCLKSVVEQTLKEIEIIVVNDGSKDNTLKKIKNISEIDNRVVIINQENKGLIEARKSGLKEAKGDYVLFVDGDDWLEVNALEILFENAKVYNSDIVLYNTIWSYTKKRENKCTFSECNDVIDNPLKALFLGEILPAIWSKFIRRDYIYKNNIKFPENISFAEDLATVSSLFINNPKISVVQEYLYNYYQREDGITKSLNQKVLEVNKAIEFIKIQLIENEIYDKYKLQFDYMVYVHLYETKFLVYDKFDYIHKELYNQYANRNINSQNRYIKNRVNKYPYGLKVRRFMYCNGYKIGIKYDKIRKVLKKVI